MSQIPESLKYSKEHEWVRIEGNKAYIGITDFAQEELGDIVFVELPEKGIHVQANTVFGTVESVKTVSDLFAPVSGKILSINSELEDSPERVNEKPYDSGWMIEIEMDNPSELANLLDANEYSQFIEE